MLRRHGARGLLAAALTVALTAGAPGPAAAKSCTRAKVDGKRVCLSPGDRCKRTNQKQYRRYGLSCSRRDSRGRYRLVRVRMNF
jgi:hypothetical protein